MQGSGEAGGGEGEVRAAVSPSRSSGRGRTRWRAGSSAARRGAACKWAEWVDGELVGGLIEPGTPWHLGHPDGEGAPVASPEHRICNVAAPSRLAAMARRAS